MGKDKDKDEDKDEDSETEDDKDKDEDSETDEEEKERFDKQLEEVHAILKKDVRRRKKKIRRAKMKFLSLTRTDGKNYTKIVDLGTPCFSLSDVKNKDVLNDLFHAGEEKVELEKDTK